MPANARILPADPGRVHQILRRAVVKRVDRSFFRMPRLRQLGFKPDTKTFFPGAPV
jgi:hypothetical protein